MTDRNGNLMDTAQQALRIQGVEHNHEMLAQRVTSGMENVQNSLGDVNMTLRSLAEKVSEFTKLQHAHDSNREATKRIEESVESLRTTVTSWFDTFNERNDDKWEDHERKNEETKEALDEKIRAVRETTLRIVTIGAVLTLLGGGVIGGFLWSINTRFAENRHVIDRNVDDIADVKLYLARGGRIPVEPYIPQRQRSKPDEQPDAANTTGKP